MQLARGPFWGWRSPLSLAVVLLAGAAFVLATSSAGRADDPPPTTVSTPTVPAPVPAPAQPPAKVQPPRKLPAPKTTARKKPKPATPAPHVASTPVQPSPTTVVSHPAAQVRPKKAKVRAHKVHRKAPVRHPRKAPVVTLTPHETLGASVSFRNQADAKSTSSSNVGSLVLILGLVITTACFSFALIPARALPWRNVATFRSERQVDVTLIGLGLLATTVMLYLMTRA